MEIWKDVVDFEGRYQVSNYGNVRSCNFANKGYSQNLIPILDKYGYAIVTLYKDRKPFNRRVHRLVAVAFIDNPKHLPQVNHINEIKNDNRLVNLEWVTCLQNNNHGTRNERVSLSKRNKKTKRVVQLDLQGNVIKTWISFNELRRQFGYDVGLLVRCCKGMKPTAYGFRWQYAS